MKAKLLKKIQVKYGCSQGITTACSYLFDSRLTVNLAFPFSVEHRSADRLVMHTIGSANVLDAVAASGVHLHHGAFALKQFGEVSHRWSGAAALTARNLKGKRLASAALRQLLRKISVTQIELIFQLLPHAGQANASAHMVHKGQARLA
jgi:hypothetical protein